MSSPYYLDVIQEIHRRLKPRTYLEIGIRNGDSLSRALDSTAIIGIDPNYNITSEFSNRIQLKRLTSDEYFEEFDPTEWLGGPVELAFIDGMHLIEFALRDFINTEKYCSPNSVIIFDDILPQNIDWAARERFTQFWTGDVFKIIELLKNYRPDLTLTILDTEPTGLLLVTGLDPHSTTLSEEFDDIIKHFLTPDPQSVPTEILQRHEAQSVSSVLDTKDVFSPNKKVEANAIETSCILGRLRRLFGK